MRRHPVLGLQRHHLLLIGIAVLLGLVVALVLDPAHDGAAYGVSRESPAFLARRE